MGVRHLHRASRPEAATIGRRVASSQDEALDRMLRPTMDERMANVYRREAALALRKSSAGNPSWSKRGLVLAFVASLVAVVFWLRRGEPSLQYEVAGESAAVGQWLAADGTAVALDFSDGSRVDVMPGGRARVTELGARRANVLLERGTLHVRVVPRERNAWVVASGPFQVHVVGTEFDVTWDADAETLSVQMESGRVRVEGPCVEPAGRHVAAPESLRVTCSAAAASASSAPVTSLAPSSAMPGDARVSPTSSASAAPIPSWQAKLRAGQLREAFAEAEAAGLERVLASATPPELVDLGSAARLAKRADVAVRFYEQARKRGAGSDAAATAAYHLGRMAFDGRGAWAEAEKWFAVYLSERPGGMLAPEALGRSMEAADKRGDRARAREIAVRYLAAYPKGAHAALAGSLSNEPP